MPYAFSLYLDILRFAAALCVLLSHANMREIVDRDLFPQSLGHDAVVIFFVLSGYVIAFVADTRESTRTSYWTSRLARVYSVALPAILLTPLLDLAGQSVSTYIYEPANTTHDLWAVRIAASLAFANEFWMVSIMPFSNSPYWSLCYEMSYYALFAIYRFEAGARRLVLLGLLALIIGPKILLLLPIWALGVALYEAKWLKAIPPLPGAVMWVVSWFAIYAYWQLHAYEVLSNFLLTAIGGVAYRNLNFSQHFVADYLLAAAVALNFVGFRAMVGTASVRKTQLTRAIAKVSANTFALYLFHMPLLLLVATLIRGDTAHMWKFSAVVIVVLTLTLLMGILTERFKKMLHLRFGKAIPAMAARATGLFRGAPFRASRQVDS
jgi:peptidoglycan/LPS O-acetylase OafA/YrhL